ncbi:flavodoxin family protein [Natronincola ferrireducens]|uniref:Flavodoxin n=1 Tax=Natronincola ferrireducens TaxID=393762 RepID=A0A1G8YXT0_9FIRM|nr:flavodoxin [Natronincola ferrireducens]SDK07557.1 Flavodoxin [Natronincola ferrireducens]
MIEKKLELRKLVIYYSFEGNTKFIAENIAKITDADLAELKPKKELTSKGFMKYIWGGSQVMMKKRPELYPLEKNPEDYDIIFIGTPVWAWTFAPPLSTFFHSNSLQNKKIALFSCNRGQNGKTFENMKKELEGNDILGEIELFDPLLKDKNKNLQKIEEWIKGMFINL